MNEPGTASGWLHGRTAHLSPTARGLMWAACSGALFCVLNALMRGLAQQLPPMQTQFLRYVFGVLVMLPLVWRAGFAAYRPNNLVGQFTRGAVHTAGLVLWFIALTHIPLADTTAIGFTGPIFIMIGAYLFLKEPMRWERWLATAIGFAGVLIVVGPGLRGFFPHHQGADAHREARRHRGLAGHQRDAVQPADGAVHVAAAHAAAVAGLCGVWRAGQRRALLPDAVIHRGRHFFHAEREVPRPDVVFGAGLAAVCRCADADHAAWRRGDLRRDTVGGAARTLRTAPVPGYLMAGAGAAVCASCFCLAMSLLAAFCM